MAVRNGVTKINPLAADLAAAGSQLYPNLHHYSILTGRIHHRGKNHVPSWWGSFTGLNTSLLPPSFGLLHLATSLKRWKLVQLSHTPKRI